MRPRHTLSLFALLAAAGSAMAISLSMQFDSGQYRRLNFPRYCVSTLVLRAEGKPRPLFLYGWGMAGQVAMEFDDMDGLAEIHAITARGEGSVRYDRYSATPALDSVQFAAGSLLRMDPLPPVDVTVARLRGFKPEDEKLKQLLDPNRGILDDRALAALAPSFDAIADIRVEVGGRRVELTDVPVRVRLRDVTTYWAVDLQARFTFRGADLGFTGDDAGPIQASLHTAGFSAVPKQHGPPQLDAPGGGLDDLDRLLR